MICTECTQRLPSDAFYATNQARCKRCVKASVTARRRADPESHRQATRRWRERQELRIRLLDHVLRILAARYPAAFFDAVMDAEDSLGLEPGFVANHMISPKGEKPTMRMP